MAPPQQAPTDSGSAFDLDLTRARLLATCSRCYQSPSATTTAYIQLWRSYDCTKDDFGSFAHPGLLPLPPPSRTHRVPRQVRPILLAMWRRCRGRLVGPFSLHTEWRALPPAR